jgi:Cu(I)/Ag(I) efflux system membrane fusion protein
MKKNFNLQLTSGNRQWAMRNGQWAKNGKRISLLFIAYCLLLIFSGCNNSTQQHQHATVVQGVMYTCPMHPQIIRNKSGDCPICGMKLVKKESSSSKLNNIQMESLLKPTNEFVVSTIPVTTMQEKNVPVEKNVLGSITYDTRYTNTISSRVSGRIEKLFVRFRYEHIHKGDAVMNIYSPELNTAQQNLIFLLKNDPANTNLINAAKEKLSLLGMSGRQLNEIMHTQKIAYTITVYSPYTGHVHDAGNMNNPENTGGLRTDVSQPSEQLSIKEGMYLQKGQPIISVFSTDHAWALLNIYASDQSLVKTGVVVTITPETAPDKAFKSTISFIEPFYRNGSKTLTARVFFNNTGLELPIGSQVKASISTTIKNKEWLPQDAILSLGIDKIVFLKEDGGFRAHKITIGITNENSIQVLSGLAANDEVAANAQFLMDSESFIKAN